MSIPLLYAPTILLPFNSAAGSTTFLDQSQYNHVITAQGEAVASSASSVLGLGSCLSCPGDQWGDGYVSTPITTGSTLDINYTTGDWTVEGWVQVPLSYIYANAPIFCFNDGTHNNLYLAITIGNAWYLWWGAAASSPTVTSTYAPGFNAGQWYHFAVVRHLGVISVFFNGTLQSATYATSGTFSVSSLFVGNGGPVGNGGVANAYTNEFRVTGAALYTASFTVPTSPFTSVIPLTTNNGDIPNPEAWVEGVSGILPPPEFVGSGGLTPVGTTGDGRYYWTGNASIQTGSCIGFVGGSAYLIDTAALQWTILQAASDGSTPVLQYCTDGHDYTSVSLGSAGTFQSPINESGLVNVTLTSASTFYVNVQSSGGTVTTGATDWVVGLAIARNANEKLPWDYSNPFNPLGYNGLIIDNNVPTATMASLSNRLLVRLGFASQAANPPPGMAALVQDFLTSAQTFLYRRYLQLHTKRLFRWKVNPGQRYYSLLDNDENVLEGVNPDYAKTIEWAGIQDSRNVWYPLIQGIPPQLYTMITKPWRPARYEIRGSIELYPAPDQTYWLWMKGHFGLMPFTLSTQSTTIDCELVFLHALANAKSHYGQPDANNIEAQANAYRAELIAATHQTAHYLPGTIAVPPAVRPTLIQFDGSGGGA
jgi:hypothetical protein